MRGIPTQSPTPLPIAALILTAAMFDFVMQSGCKSQNDSAQPPTATSPASASASSITAPGASPQRAPTQPSAPADALAGGFSATCAHAIDHTVRCWGRIGTWLDADVPTVVPGLHDTASVALYSPTIWARMTDGSLTCWGDSKPGATCGWGSVNPAQRNLFGLSGITEISDSQNTTCARLASGRVSCWGKNDSGQLGIGSTDPSNTPKEVVGISHAIAITTQAGRSCAVTKDGEALCWGRKFLTDLPVAAPSGHAQTPTPSTAAPVNTVSIEKKPVAIAGLANVTQVALGEEHACVRLTDGTVRCWGVNPEGELGDGSRGGKLSPVSAKGLSDVVQITAGAHHTCARLGSGTVQCWGRNWHGELGDGTTISRRTPTEIANLNNAFQLIAGAGHTCALVEGKVKCWGANADGQLGDGTREAKYSPVNVGM